jgi:hypothetical protein
MPVVSTTIFAPRRTGKTVFLRKDLTPAAEAAGFTVAYVDLWQTRLNPGIAIVRGLEDGLKTKTIISKTPGGVHTFESAAFERWVRTLAPANT